MKTPPEIHTTKPWSPDHQPRGKRHQHGKPAWRHHLPQEWQDAIEAPLYFEQHREYEISAGRSVGYDADDRPCFTSHYYLLTSLASDDDEEFYEVITYCEEMSAWRMRDGRWLIYRQKSDNQCNQPGSFYIFATCMPR
jgi:hypothetical protein